MINFSCLLESETFDISLLINFRCAHNESDKTTKSFFKDAT